jgi:hypothetical protein
MKKHNITLKGRSNIENNFVKNSPSTFVNNEYNELRSCFSIVLVESNGGPRPIVTSNFMWLNSSHFQSEDSFIKRTLQVINNVL